MAAEALKTIESFSQQNLANLAWAYGKLAHFQAALMGAIAERASQMIKVRKVPLTCLMPRTSLHLLLCENFWPADCTASNKMAGLWRIVQWTGLAFASRFA